MNNHLLNTLSRITLLITFNLSLVACGGGGGGSTATTNTAPVATDAAVSVLPDAAVSGTLAATDVDGDSLTYSIVTNASNGTLTLDEATGAYTYTHNSSINADSFTFLANDGALNSNTATITVTTANSAPVAMDASVSLLPGGTVTGTLAVNDVDGDNQTISIVTGASNGTLTLDNAATGAYTYVHGGAANGDSFTFWSNDGLLDSNIATVTVTTVVSEAPANGLLATAGDQRVTVNWDAVPGADSYNVYRTDISGTGTAGTQITGVTPPYYHDGVTNGLNYYYVVTSVNAVGESVASSEVNATPVDISIGSLMFTDANLGDCVAAAGAGLDVHELTSLNCGSKSITQLTGIEALTSLNLLYLQDNSIIDVSPLAGLTSLTYLNLWGNSIIDVSPLADLTSLTTLRLYNNTISDVSPLAGLTSLTTLYLLNNSIINVSPLAGLTSLTTLHLGENSISDVSPLAGLTSLTTLNLGANTISVASPLAGLTSLTFLDLNNNTISDVSPLAGLTSLIDLRLNNNTISDVSPLAGLTSLTLLYLGNNIVMSCSTLTDLIASLGSPPVDTDYFLNNTDVAINGKNCTDTPN